MKLNTELKKKIRNHELTVGSWLTIPHPSIAEIMADAGFDWLALDMEHGAINIDQCLNLIRTLDLKGVPALVRVGANDPLLIKQAMDCGAHGVIVPMINSRESALQAVSAVKYPPSGTRGVGLARAQGYGFAFDEYVKWVGKHSLLIVQIEHIQAVENLEDILSVDEVDGFIVGPYDLSASLNRPGDFTHPEVLAALQRINEVADKLKKTAGFHSVSPDPELARAKIKEGYKLVAYSTDFFLLGQKAREGLKSLR